jgi:hypothetical protein
VKGVGDPPAAPASWRVTLTMRAAVEAGTG